MNRGEIGEKTDWTGHALEATTSSLKLGLNESLDGFTFVSQGQQLADTNLQRTPLDVTMRSLRLETQ